MSGEEKLSDMDTNGAEPVSIITKNAGDSKGIASGIAQRATGVEGAFETETSATCTTPSAEETAAPGNSNVSKKPVSPKRDDSRKDKGGYGLLVISGLVLVIGGIVGALIKFAKRKKSSSL